MAATTAQALNVLPAPRFANQGDFIHVSTIYPLTAEGEVVHSDSISSYVGEAEIAAQTRAILETLREVLAEADSSLERVLKAEVYLVDPTEFYEFKLVSGGNTSRKSHRRGRRQSSGMTTSLPGRG